MTRRIALALSCCALAACGGGGDHTNAATARSFSYGPEQSVAAPLSAGDAISSMKSFESAGDGQTAVAAQGSLMQVAFEALGDDLGVGGFAATSANPTALVREARSRTIGAALTGDASQFTAECTTAAKDAAGTATVVFKNCQYTETTTEGTLTVNVAGTVVGKPGSVVWDVTYNLSLTGPDARIELGYHDKGNLALTAATVKAHQEADIGGAFASGLQHLELGLAQSVDLDVTIDGSCATHITGGTLEAKRVWTKRPAGAAAEATVDRGALFTWTGCGLATVRFSR
ncbi:MAG TPA: hypothetical protein VFK85_09265 [Anaeromyxobacteraceae bacterium]|nr:hypothetical protein [Anaeromyxobacteraceae bacterium]